MSSRIDFVCRVCKPYDFTTFFFPFFFNLPKLELGELQQCHPLRFTFYCLLIREIDVQEFVEARRTAALNNAPSCMWSAAPPLELKGAPPETLTANAGFVTFGQDKIKFNFLLRLCIHISNMHLSIYAVVFPRHVEGKKLDKTVWSLLTFHAYVSYHVKVGGFLFLITT